MTPLAFTFHLFGLVASAMGLALLVPFLGRIFARNKPLGVGLIAQIAIHFVAGLLVLAGGLLLWGQDGRMATYAALVVVCGTVQWVLARGWR